MANRYRNTQQINTSDGIPYLVNTIYPDIPLSEDDFYVITTGGDRYDTLATQFYNDHTLWWIIASANVSERGSLAVKPGVQLRIPANKERILEAYNQVNSTR